MFRAVDGGGLFECLENEVEIVDAVMEGGLMRRERGAVKRRGKRKDI